MSCVADATLSTIPTVVELPLLLLAATISLASDAFVQAGKGTQVWHLTNNATATLHLCCQFHYDASFCHHSSN